jgi:hypothetical protein
MADRWSKIIGRGNEWPRDDARATRAVPSDGREDAWPWRVVDARTGCGSILVRLRMQHPTKAHQLDN